MHQNAQCQPLSTDGPSSEGCTLPGAKCLLLVDDNPEDLELVQRILETQKPRQQVVVANDGAEALDFLYRRGRFSARRGENPTVVLLDLKMPLVDGFEVLQHIKGDPELKTIPVVMFTSSNQSGDMFRCYELGANAYVVKPVEFQELAAKVREIERFWIVVNEPPPGLGAEGADGS